MRWIKYLISSQKYFISIPLLAGLVCSASLSGIGISVSSDLIPVMADLNIVGYLVLSLLLLIWSSTLLWVYISRSHINTYTSVISFILSYLIILTIYVSTHVIFSFMSISALSVFVTKHKPSVLLLRVFIDGLASMSVFLTIPIFWSNPRDEIQSVRRARGELIQLLKRIHRGENLSGRDECRVIENLNTIAEVDSTLEHLLASEWDKYLLREWKGTAEAYCRPLDEDGPKGEVVRYLRKSGRAKDLMESLKVKIF